MARPARTDHRARYCLLSDDHSPCGVWGITSWSLVASGGENFDKRCRDFRRRQNRGISEILGWRRLKSPDHILFNLAKRVMDGRGLAFSVVQRSGTEAKWQSSDTALPIRGKSYDGLSGWSLAGRFNLCAGFSESLRICLQAYLIVMYNIIPTLLIFP